MMTNSLFRRLVRRSPLALLAALPLAGCMSMADYGEATGYERGYPDYPRDADGWYGRDVASVDIFYSSLGRYGRWDSHPGYGRVFVPYGVGASWQPYAQGYWADDPRFGRRWVSSEPFGWATYHYGRWARDPRLGWFWVPDTRFGPGWVSWREGNGYAGWSPLPPRGWERWGVGYNPWGYDNWMFAPHSYLYRPGMYSHIVRGRPHYDRTRPVERPVARPDRPDRPADWAGRPNGEGREPGWQPREGRPGWAERDGATPLERDGATRAERGRPAGSSQRDGQRDVQRDAGVVRERPADWGGERTRGGRAERPVGDTGSAAVARPQREARPVSVAQAAPAPAQRAEAQSAPTQRVEAQAAPVRERPAPARERSGRMQPQ